MAEGGGFPAIQRVTTFTIMDKLSREMRRCLCCIIIFLVALEAIGVRQRVVSICMTVLAWNAQMRTLQLKIRSVVTERRRVPSVRGVTLRTVVYEHSGNVIRLLRVVEIVDVALLAIDILERVVAVDMAVFTLG